MVFVLRTGWVVTAALLGALVGAPSAQAGGSVVCRYVYYDNEYQMCMSPPVVEAKKACEEQAEKKHKEKLSCFCTDDPAYVGDFCKQHAPKK